MIGLDDVVEGVLGGTSWGLGVTAVAIGAVVAAPRAKPLAKGAIKGYLAATQRVREWTAESTERLQDLYAEAKHEFEVGLDEGAEAEAEPAKPAGRSRRRAEAAPAEQPA
jgi:hypothetical protein